MAKTTTGPKQAKGSEESLAVIRAARKRDALALAHLIYDIYKEELASGKISNGQNDANQTKKN